MLKALLLLLALGVNLTWATTHTAFFSDLTEAELQDMATTMAAVYAARVQGDSRRLGETSRKLSSSIISSYAARSAFDTAAPGLPVEDFEGSNAISGNVLPCGANPLTSLETVCFPSGSSIEPGLGVLSSGLEVATLNDLVVGSPGHWVAANPFQEAASLVFTSPFPMVVGLDFFDYFPTTSIDIIITYENDEIETVSVPRTGVTSFYGVITDKPIKKMQIGGTTTNLILIDNVAFGIVAPPPCTTGTAGCDGDPHFKTWRGQRYDFHGECDLVLLQSKEFESGLGLDVHIRTTIRRDMSYISSAVIRIGKDVLEVESQGVYWLNGALNADMPDEFSGFAFSHAQPTDKQHVFEVHLGGRERVKVKTYKDFVSVLIEQGENKHFGDSTGLMGDFRMGHMIARDGNTVIEDANAFGQEWQVLDTEPSLFQTVRLPQHPNVCTMPTPVQADHLRRRLAETSLVDEAAAEKACEHWGDGKDDCVFDVLATGDLEMAVVGAY
jgi:hypothetical protein